MAGIKALAEEVEITGFDLAVSFVNNIFYTVRPGGSRSQPVHWALVYDVAPDGTTTQRNHKRSTVVKTLNCEVMIGGRSVGSKGDAPRSFE